jgi:hypothetical protein
MHNVHLFRHGMHELHQHAYVVFAIFENRLLFRLRNKVNFPMTYHRQVHLLFAYIIHNARRLVALD